MTANRRSAVLTGLGLLGFLFCDVAIAGPPYAADDPQPTNVRQYEVYLFSSGQQQVDGHSAVIGVDFNYGAAPDLQLTAVLPVVRDAANDARVATGLGNVELAAKYRFLHQADSGWDVAVFPRVFLRSASASVGEQHAALLLPIWLEKDWNNWATFGGGGCAINQGGESRNYCLLAWALTRQLLPTLRLGAELQYQTADTRNGRASSAVGAGLQYDINEYCQLLAYMAPGLQNTSQTARYSWYAALLLRF